MDKKCCFSYFPSRSDAELQFYCRDFENFSCGPQTRAVSAELMGKIGQNLPKSGERFPKKGGIVLLTNFLPLSDVKFNVDYDFAIKHDLIP